MVAKRENFDGLREGVATVGQLRLLGEVVAKRENSDGLREGVATVGQLRLLGEVVAKRERRIEGDDSNGGTIEVVGGGGCEKRKCRRVGRGGGGGVDDSKCCVVLNEDLYLKINGDAGDRERGYGFNREVRGRVVEVAICLLRSIVVLLILVADNLSLGVSWKCNADA